LKPPMSLCKGLKRIWARKNNTKIQVQMVKLSQFENSFQKINLKSCMGGLKLHVAILDLSMSYSMDVLNVTAL
jgi:hypothetical protein